MGIRKNRLMRDGAHSLLVLDDARARGVQRIWISRVRFLTAKKEPLGGVLGGSLRENPLERAADLGVSTRASDLRAIYLSVV